MYIVKSIFHQIKIRFTLAIEFCNLNNSKLSKNNCNNLEILQLQKFNATHGSTEFSVFCHLEMNGKVFICEVVGNTGLSR